MSELLWAAALWGLGGLALAGGVFHAAVALRVLRALSPRPTLRAGVDAPSPAGGWPRVAIVVPAHNEAAVISGLARSIRLLDYPDFTVVFALDRCQDDTAGVIRAAMTPEAGEFAPPRFDIVEIDACPDDWHGKPHAVHAGLTRSPLTQRAELLLFVDADTRFDPSCLKAAVALHRQRSLGLLSLLSSLEAQRWWERVVQPWAAFELLRKHPIDRVNRAVKPRGFANGQFLLFARSAYECVGGHEAVKHHVLEDIALARRCVKRGARVHLLLADGLFSCRMYRSWDSFARGWKRIYSEAFRCQALRLRRAGRRLLLTSVAAPLATVAAIVLASALLAAGDASLLIRASAVGAVVAGALSLLAWLVFSVIVLRAQRASLSWLALAPVGAAVVARLLFQAASDLKRGAPMRWAGREFTRPDRSQRRPAMSVPSSRADSPDE